MEAITLSINVLVKVAKKKKMVVIEQREMASCSGRVDLG